MINWKNFKSIEVRDVLRLGKNAKIHVQAAGTTADAELTLTELQYLDGLTAGTVTASKAVVVDSNKDITGFRNVTATGSFIIGNASMNEADLEQLDGITAGTAAASKALVLDSSSFLNWTVSSASTDGGTSVEPLNFDTTMTGIGGVGGRAKFTLTTNVALGAWSNALKAEMTYGAAGKTTGLGSAFVAEMTLSAGTVDGTYAPVEIELNLGSGASTGTKTSLIYASVNGADASTFDTNGALFNIAGVTAGDAKFLDNTVNITNVNEITAGLRVIVAGAEYYLLMATKADVDDA